MRKHLPRSRPVLSLAAGALTLLTALPAAEAHSGLYFGLGFGVGNFSGRELITQETDQGDDQPDMRAETCCPANGLSSELRLGFSIFGFGGPEVGVIGNGWDLGNNAGGAGFIGGGIRVFPLRFLSLVGLTSEDFPLVFGTGVMYGYTITGKDFAYQGTFLDVDFTLEYRLLSVLSAGVRVDLIFPNYDDFVFTSYKNDRGRCLNTDAEQITQGEQNGVIERSQANCSGRGPKTTFVSPQLVFTFHFDLLGPL